MTAALQSLVATTRPLRPETLATLSQIKVGDRIRITHTVRISSTRSWTTSVVGVFRGVQALVTGLSTNRRLEDDVIVPTVHFTKDSGEQSSVALDEQTLVEFEAAK